MPSLLYDFWWKIDVTAHCITQQELPNVIADCPHDFLNIGLDLACIHFSQLRTGCPLLTAIIQVIHHKLPFIAYSMPSLSDVFEASISAFSCPNTSVQTRY